MLNNTRNLCRESQDKKTKFNIEESGKGPINKNSKFDSSDLHRVSKKVMAR